MSYEETKTTNVNLAIGKSLMNEANDGNITGVENDVAKYFLHAIIKQENYVLYGITADKPHGGNWSLRGNINYWHSKAQRALELDKDSQDTNIDVNTPIQRSRHAKKAFEIAKANFTKMKQAFAVAVGDEWSKGYYDPKTNVSKTIKEFTDAEMQKLYKEFGVEEKEQTIDDRTGTDG